MHALRHSARRATVVGAIVGFIAMVACQSKGASSNDVVATVGGKPITQAELDARLGNELLGLKTQEFEMAEGELRNMIADQLIDAEAARRKISKEALLKSEIDDKVPVLSEADLRTEYEALKPRLGDRSEEQGLRDVREYLEGQRKAQRRAEFIQGLMAAAGVKIQLEPPRAAVSADDDPSEGPKNAPVTMVEFSDFQCPHCASVEMTLKQLRQRYGDRLRIVFRDFPLPFHAQAPKAGEAAQCANDQGKFWEMHDHLFAHQNQLAVPDLKAAARTIGLDGAMFDACLDSGRYASEQQKDIEDGKSYGVSATPSFFVNGRLLMGAQPVERFIEVIDAELNRAGIEPPKTASK